MRIFPYLRKKSLTGNLIFVQCRKASSFQGGDFFCEIFHKTVTGTEVLLKTYLLEFILNNSNAFSFRKEAVCISYFLPSGVDLQQDTSALCPVNIFFSLPSYVSYGFISRTTCSKVLYLIAVLENFANVSGNDLWRSTSQVLLCQIFQNRYF